MTTKPAHSEHAQTCIAHAERFMAAADRVQAEPHARLDAAQNARTYAEIAVHEAAHDAWHRKLVEGPEAGPTDLQTRASKVADLTIHCFHRTCVAVLKRR